jgi:hypothetical protein
MFKTTAIAATAFLAVAAWSPAQSAVFTSCVGTDPVYDISGKVSGATACTISDATQDFQNTDPITVNDPPGFFNITDWFFHGKIGTANLAGTGTAGGQSGTFDLSGLTGLGGTVMLVFKDGGGTTLVGYLLGSLSGTWDSPFTIPPFVNANGSSPKDVSHISVYSFGDDPDDCVPGDTRPECNPPVPEPGTLGLLGLGLLGLGLSRRRVI